MSEIHQNADNDELLPLGNSQVRIGYVDEVNGEGAREVPEFVPTRHELLQLVKHWVRKTLTTQLDCFFYDQSGSYEYRIIGFGNRRIARISELVGQERVDAIVEEVFEEFEKKHDPKFGISFEMATKPNETHCKRKCIDTTRKRDATLNAQKKTVRNLTNWIGLG